MEILNYNVKPMVENFNMHNFLKKNNTIERDLGFLLITRDQIICGSTRDHNIRSHDVLISNALRSVSNFKSFETEGDQYRASELAKNNYITAYFTNERENGVHIVFDLKSLRLISSQELSLFEQFYDDNNEIINNYSLSCGKPVVTLVLPDLYEPVDGDYSNIVTSNNLDIVLSHLRKIVLDYKILPNDSKIIGEALPIKKRR